MCGGYEVKVRGGSLCQDPEIHLVLAFTSANALIGLQGRCLLLVAGDSPLSSEPHHCQRIPHVFLCPKSARGSRIYKHQHPGKVHQGRHLQPVFVCRGCCFFCASRELRRGGICTPLSTPLISRQPCAPAFVDSSYGSSGREGRARPLAG